MSPEIIIYLCINHRFGQNKNMDSGKDQSVLVRSSHVDYKVGLFIIDILNLPIWLLKNDKYLLSRLLPQHKIYRVLLNTIYL